MASPGVLRNIHELIVNGRFDDAIALCAKARQGSQLPDWYWAGRDERLHLRRKSEKFFDKIYASFANMRCICPTCISIDATLFEAAHCQGCIQQPRYEWRLQHADCHDAMTVYRWKGDVERQDPLSSMWRRFKRSGDHKDVALYFGLLFCEWLVECLPARLAEYHVIIPVPRSESGVQRRGRSPLLEVCTLMSQYFCIPTRSTYIRDVGTQELKKLPLEQRKHSVRGRFLRDDSADDLKGLNVVLVDDVLTSGSTLDACAGVLKRLCDVEKVCALTMFQSESSKQSRQAEAQ